MTESQAKGLGALVTSLLTLVLLVLGALLIQPRLSERRQLLPDRYVLTADEVAALPQGTLPVVCWIDASVRIRTTFAFAFAFAC